MLKTTSPDAARYLANKNNLCWGYSVFNCYYYVGTPQQLRQVGVATIN